ncbi:hypothetical protein [Streptomyces sp. NPDC059631]|uniref:hypothetical protein n=1 Tax=unclassified Streptomyces TaxID=2593676 RepID=UPI0036B99B47
MPQPAKFFAMLGPGRTRVGNLLFHAAEAAALRLAEEGRPHRVPRGRTSDAHRETAGEGWEITEPAHISPYLTERINRFGEYSTHELGIQPEAYGPEPDVDFTLLREQDLPTAGLGRAA